jgi:hypothetical protein
MAVTLTESAAKHVARSLAKRGKGVGLRLGVRTSGCSGLAYKLEYADAVQPQQVVRAVDRVLQRLVRLVDARRRLERQPAHGLGAGGKAVRVDLALQRAVATLERRGVHVEAFGHAEELEVVAGEVDHRALRKGGLPIGRRGARSAAGRTPCPRGRRAP